MRHSAGPFRNPWTGNVDSPVDYSLPAVEIAANACRHAVESLARSLHIVDTEFSATVVAEAYMRSISTVRQWDTALPFYHHCRNCVMQVYPEILRQRNTSSACRIDSYDGAVSDIPVRVTASDGTYADYRKTMVTDSIRRIRQKHTSG